MNVPGDDRKTYGERQLSFLLRQPQDDAKHRECLLEIRNSERTLCLVHFSSSNHTWVFSRHSLKG